MEADQIRNTSISEGKPAERALVIGEPGSEDGAAVHDLIAACPPLDGNSLYANLLQCSHFAGTCAIARMRGEVCGWVSGYIPPGQPDTYFLWQVAVNETARGQKLPKRLIRDILDRPACADVTRLQTTITPDNQASWGLFRSVARWLEADLSHVPHFERDRHFAGRHDTEHLVTIAPFRTPPPPTV